MISNFLNDFLMYARFAFGLKKFFKEKITFAETRQVIKKRMEQREENFLNMIRRGVFGYKKSPYLSLFKLLNYEFKDIEKLVSKFGIEGALKVLKDDGVYFTIEEFKCKKPVKRKGREFIFKERDFDNPYTAPCYQMRSSGARSAGTRIAADFNYISDMAVYDGVAIDIWNQTRAPHVSLHNVFSLGAGMGLVLRLSKFGIYPVRWISLVDSRKAISLRNKLGIFYIFFISRILGIKFPKPEFMNLKDIPKVVEFIDIILKKHKECCVSAQISSAVRLCLAAKEKGLILDGIKFYFGGEPFTLAKYNGIKSVEAKYILKYGFTEGGLVGNQCLNHTMLDDVHLFKDKLVLISYEKKVIDSYVNAFLFTTLLPSMPKILLNVENGDYGIIEIRKCGCPYDALGYDTHIYNIRSFEKLTGEGMTFYGTGLIRLVEEVLPFKFGGSSIDYQLVEEEGKQGFRHLSVMVSPKIGNLDEAEVIKTVLDILKKEGDSQKVMAEVWFQAGTVRVRRDYPILAKSGKLYPLYILHKEEV